MKRDPENEPLSDDEIKREDGLERYWLFYNGEWAETICGLCAAMSGVFWCFLYVLGYGQTVLGYILGAIVVIGLISLRFLNARIDELEEKGWRKERGRTPNREKRELYLAAGLWAFILLFFGTLFLLGYAHHP